MPEEGLTFFCTLGRRKHYKSEGAYRLRGTSKGFLEVRLALSMVGKTTNTSEGGPGHASPEILRLRSSEITGNVYFSIYFAFLKFSTRTTRSHEKGHFDQAFDK